MSISVSDILENAFTEWFEGDEFENREKFEEAVDEFVDSVIEDVADVGRSICKLSDAELADQLSVYIKDDSEEEDYE